MDPAEQASEGPPATAQPLCSGDTVRDGRYEIEKPLRGGAEKQVYLARDLTFDYQVALDVFADDTVLPNGMSVSAWEARVLGKLGDHSNLVTVQDRWEESGSAFMASRYLPGGSLAERIAKGGDPMPVEEILRVAADIARGLEHIHSHGILYRDLQPRNVLFDEWDTARLVDFDIACSLDDSEMTDISGRSVIAYMAPEQLEGRRGDERSDLYSLGATMYEICSGAPPFVGEREEIIRAKGSGPLTLDREDLPQGLIDLTLGLLATDPQLRIPSARDVLQRLAQLQSAQADLDQLLNSDETATLEFKSSLRTPVGYELPDDLSDAKRQELLTNKGKALERAITKTIAAFLNTSGGTLVVGRADDGEVIGIETDFPDAGTDLGDEWRLKFDNLIDRDLGAEVSQWFDLELHSYKDRTVAVITCSPRDAPTYYEGEEVFVRRTASTVQLTPRQTLAWFDHERPGNRAEEG